MTPEAQTLDAVLKALVAAVIGAIATIGIPALFKWFSGRLENANAREKAALEDDTVEEQLDIETRQLTNRLARVAFDREEQLSRLKAEYAEQSELLRLTRKQLEDCKGVEVGEYRHQVSALLEQINALENTIAKLRNDVAILEATR
jgi:uncharacterized protein HemX